ncbi:MAG: 2-dehydropantoate 2-reductase [Thermoleophilaceae bacterium]|jgi:2-dehydropantoate 2-reductase|nr:2-dehydropantoate 2-reductase [Thermoleophilaceae bacterium]
MSEIAILGPGGVGGFLAAALERAGTRATIVAREGTAAALNERGIEVDSVRLGSFHASPRAVASLDVTGCTLVVATKAVGLSAALDRVQGSPSLVVPLLNGLDHVELLRARYGEYAVAAASIRIESHRPETGRIVQSSPFLRIDIAPPTGAVESFAALMHAAEVPVAVLESEAQVMWGKLVRLQAVALATSAYDLPIGAIRSDPERREMLEGCVAEAVAVGQAEGADVSQERVMAEIDDIHPTLESSMMRDIAAGREPELDAIAGAVLRTARRHGLEAPTIARLAAHVAERAGVAWAP